MLDIYAAIVADKQQKAENEAEMAKKKADSEPSGDPVKRLPPGNLNFDKIVQP
ncbi:MAG: hypothetical protein PHW04_18200 [Candidatus Wallbacteria bacterium]|nr:hypothetical protein [Candidatus Wallbacteria bacterium]